MTDTLFCFEVTIWENHMKEYLMSMTVPLDNVVFFTFMLKLFNTGVFVITSWWGLHEGIFFNKGVCSFIYNYKNVVVQALKVLMILEDQKPPHPKKSSEKSTAASWMTADWNWRM